MKFYFNGPSTSHKPCLICKGIENLTIEKDKTQEQHHKFPTNLTQWEYEYAIWWVLYDRSLKKYKINKDMAVEIIA